MAEITEENLLLKLEECKQQLNAHWQQVAEHVLCLQAAAAQAARGAAAERRAAAEVQLAAAHQLRQEATDSFTAACPSLDAAVGALHPACTQLQAAFKSLQAEGDHSTTALTELLRLTQVSPGCRRRACVCMLPSLALGQAVLSWECSFAGEGLCCTSAVGGQQH